MSRRFVYGVPSLRVNSHFSPEPSAARMSSSGSGFSSLGYLSTLPVDTLKIDRSFIAAMTAGPEGLALVSTIISLSHALKLNVVAEGVETEEQSRLLRLLSCDEMQGYLFSKPVPEEIFETRYLPPPSAGDDLFSNERYSGSTVSDTGHL